MTTSTVFVGNNVNSPIRTSAIGLLQHLQLLYLPSELDIDEQIQQVTLYFYCMQYQYHPVIPTKTFIRFRSNRDLRLRVEFPPKWMRVHLCERFHEPWSTLFSLIISIRVIKLGNGKFKHLCGSVLVAFYARELPVLRRGQSRGGYSRCSRVYQLTDSNNSEIWLFCAYGVGGCTKNLGPCL
jgi:hypothetical protein